MPKSLGRFEPRFVVGLSNIFLQKYEVNVRSLRHNNCLGANNKIKKLDRDRNHVNPLRRN